MTELEAAALVLSLVVCVLLEMAWQLLLVC
jgi:hypothetical protein